MKLKTVNSAFPVGDALQISDSEAERFDHALGAATISKISFGICSRLKPVAKVHLFFDASSFQRALFVERGELPQLSLQLDPGLHAATHLALGSFRHIIAGSLSTLPAARQLLDLLKQSLAGG
jgi:hypothetical protein